MVSFPAAGWGSQGQLGTNSLANALAPTAVVAPADVAVWSQVSAGGTHTCALTSSGALFCWGAGGQGRLGTGNTASARVPAAVAAPSVAAWAQVSAGVYHTCGVTALGAALCWGQGGYGRLGLGSFIDQFAPAAVTAPAGWDAAGWAAVDASKTHTCALQVNGAAACWGEGAYGKLGTNSSADQPLPMPVVAPVGAAWAQISTGGAHTILLRRNEPLAPAG